MKHSTKFTLDKKGLTEFTRQLTVNELMLLMIICDQIKVTVTGKNKGDLIFIFVKPGRINTYARVKGMKFYLLRMFLPPDEWINGLPYQV